MEYSHPIHFTLFEAQQMLPEVIAALKRMQELKRKLDESGYDIQYHRYFGGISMNGVLGRPQPMQELIDLYEHLSRMGIQLKDIDRGLIDFPAIRPNGEEVYLCYLLGEQAIQYWHRIQDGFGGRQHIDTL